MLIQRVCIHNNQRLCCLLLSFFFVVVVAIATQGGGVDLSLINYEHLSWTNDNYRKGKRIRLYVVGINNAVRK